MIVHVGPAPQIAYNASIKLHMILNALDASVDMVPSYITDQFASLVAGVLHINVSL